MKHLHHSDVLITSGRFIFIFLMAIFYFINSVNTQPKLTFTPLIRNLSKPVEIKNAGDGSNRLFIVEQTGAVKIYKNDKLLKKPFLDLTNIVATDSFKGLWSIAFPPDYTTSRFFFVFYVNKNNVTVLARYRTSKANPDSALPESEVKLLSLSGKNTGGPKLGQLNFGRDGYLYVTITDGSFYEKVTDFAQDGHLLFGKMLRLNIVTDKPPYYKIPPDNPYVNDTAVLDEIYDLGLHNAWRWSFDRKTGDMWIGDPGGDRWDEVNFRKASKTAAINYGWPCYEADQSYLTKGCLNKKNYEFPIFAYPHDNKVGNAIIGGYVYRGKAYPFLNGYYISSDYYNLTAWKIIPDGSSGWNVYKQRNIPPEIGGYGEDEKGELYAASLLGTVYKIGAIAGAGSEASFSFEYSENKNLKTKIYATLVNDNEITLDLKESYRSFILYDVSGSEVVKRNLNGQKEKVTIILDKLPSGMYLIKLAGLQNNFYQKIYISGNK